MATKIVRRSMLATMLVFAGLVAAACASSKGSVKKVDIVVDVSGTVVDYKTGAAVPNASLKTVGIIPEIDATADATGAFTLVAVPINGYVIVEANATGYVDTLNPALLIQEQSVSGIQVMVLSSSDASGFKTGFGVLDTAGRAEIVGKTAFDTGAGIAGISAISLLPVGLPSDGPHFLDAAGNPAAGLAATSSSGGFTFFNVGTGNVAVQASAPNFLFQPVATVARAGAWAIVTVIGQGGTPGSTPTPTPTGTPGPVSFAQKVVPIFSARGCSQGACHGTGHPTGNMRLDQTATKDYANIMALPGVVDTANPAASLLLTKPLFEAVPNHGGGNIFLTTSDPDYVTILNWITQGAPNN